ncbi:hypothetical protein ACFXDE_33125 [Kitasatospora sp. NPDC059408]|uniref:hypothetical protein n=1 Tax=Kitasatospora sp. NPDC059408 TaxID=3346823 RepID=UPI0036C68CAF
MPRRSPRPVRAGPAGRQGHGPVGTLLITACPGPPTCSAVHTYLFVDGLDLIARTHDGATGGHPGRLLRPAGPLYPSDQARQVHVATHGQGPDAAPAVGIRIRLRGRTVVWDGLMYPDARDRIIEEVRFDAAQYLTEIERVYTRWGRGT